VDDRGVRVVRILLIAGVPLLALAATVNGGEFASPSGARRLVVDDDLAFRLIGPRGEVVARGTIATRPALVHVLDAPPGAVVGEPDGTLRRIDASGTIAWAAPARTAERAWWVDEAKGRVVAVAKDGTVAEIDLGTGRLVAAGGAAAILRGVDLAWARKTALEVGLERRTPGLDRKAAALVGDADPYVRLLAILATDGAADVALYETALAHERPLAERRRALDLAARRLGDDAIGLLARNALDPALAHAALAGLARFGDRAVPAIAGVMAHGDTKPAARREAATLLGKLDPAAVGAAVAKRFRDADAGLAADLLRAGIAAGVPDLHRRLLPYERTLLGLLRRDAGDVDWLADHFARHATTNAVDPLLQSLGRHTRDAATKKRILTALRACTGLDFGDDPRAWRDGLNR